MMLYLLIAVISAFVCQLFLQKDIKSVLKKWDTYVLALVFAALFILFSKTLGSEIGTIKAIAITNGLYIAAVTDMQSREIPNQIVLLFLVLGIILVLPSFNSAIYLDALGGALIASGLLFVAHVLSKGDVGMGDVKLFGVVGIYLGFFNTLNSMLLSMILGTIYGLIIMLIKGKNLKSSIPFAPFMAVGSITTIILSR